MTEKLLPHIPAMLFGALRQMDAEATTSRNGQPTGLNWYGGHARPHLKKPQTEPCWSKRLAELLTERGLPTTAEVPYPSSTGGRRRKSDLVITLPSGQRFWIEVKGAWKAYWAATGKLGIYRSYLAYRPGSNLLAKSHTAALDLDKLASLGRHDATHVGLLLVGFDSGAFPMQNDIDAFCQREKLDRPPWKLNSATWPDARRPNESVRCWFWWRHTSSRPTAG
jgi:hypothetical protein